MKGKSETTTEFCRRLVQAVESHPLAPPTPHGRQSWLRDVLRKQTGRNVSPNTVHKWFNAMSLPRPDTIRALARVLKVDELWLTTGHRPMPSEAREERAATASGIPLLVAGLIEVHGGKVTFPDADEGAVSLYANIGARSFGVVLAAPQPGTSKDLAFIIPEPTGDSAVIGVVARHAEGCNNTACVDLLDLTSVPRENLGGFSVVRLEHRRQRTYEVAGTGSLIRPIKNVMEIASEVA